MFPSSGTASLPLERTMRFLPHHQNTGGFFVAVLEKVAECTDLTVPTQPNKKRKEHEELNKEEKRCKVATETPLKNALDTGDAAPGDRSSLAGKEASNLEAAADTEDVHESRADAASSSGTPERTFQSVLRGAAVGGSSAAAASGGAAVDSAASRKGPKEEGDTALRWVLRGGNRGGAGGYQRKYRGLDPVIPVTDPGLLSPVEEFYGLRRDFPLRTHLITRCFEALDRPRRLYFISDAARRVLMLDEGESLKVTATGLKVRRRCNHVFVSFCNEREC